MISVPVGKCGRLQENVILRGQLVLCEPISQECQQIVSECLVLLVAGVRTYDSSDDLAYLQVGTPTTPASSTSQYSGNAFSISWG